MFKKIKNSFFVVNERELSRFSKMVMIIFFFVSLFVLEQGIQLNLHQTERPSVQYGYKCVDFVRGNDFHLYNFKKDSYSYDDTAFGKNKLCKEIQKEYTLLKHDFEIQSSLSQIDILNRKLSREKSDADRINKKYSEMLLEKIAGQNEDKSILKTRADSAKKELNEHAKKISLISSLIKEKEDINNYPKILKFKKNLLIKKEDIESGLASLRKWYGLKRSGQVIGFLIPVWLLFYFIYRNLEKRKKFIFAHLSSYVANASALLLLIEIIHIIYVIIPKVFLGKFIAFLVSLNLGIILNVITIVFFLFIFGLIIKKVQNREIKKKKSSDSRILNTNLNKCWNCGISKFDEAPFCKNCGENLYEQCSSCNKKIEKFSSFCKYCGKD